MSLCNFYCTFLCSCDIFRMSLEVLSTKEHTDDGYGRQYSAKHTVSTTYKHPKGVSFMHIHEDGKDYEDIYRYETVSIGDINIRYSYDWGNYFTWEYVKISKQSDEISYAQQEFGPVDPLKKETRQADKGKEVLTQLSEDLCLSLKDFVHLLTSNFKISSDVLNLFL